MTHRRQIAVAVLAALASVLLADSPALADYRTLDVEGLRITVDTDWARSMSPGYLPVRLDIANVNDAREIQLVAVSRRFFYGRVVAGNGSTITVRRTIRLARGGRVAVTLPVLIAAENDTLQLEVRENGRTLERLGAWSTQAGRAGLSAIILAQPGSAFAEVSKPWPRSPAVPTPMGVPPAAITARGLPPTDFVLDPARAPNSWLGWTSTIAVFVHDGEWRQLSDTQRAALRTWIAAGGELVLVDGTITTIFPNERPPELRPSTVAGSSSVADYFFGHIHLLSATAITSRGLQDTLDAIVKTSANSRLSLPVIRSVDWGRTEARGFRLAIPGVFGVPTRAYLVILLLFSVLIGPANFLFLTRRRLQVLFVLTAPIVATVFIALLAGYVVFGEGVGVRARAITVTQLDQDRKQAATRALASLYAAGMTPSGGLDFPSDVAVIPTGTDGNFTTETMTVDLTDSQRFTSGAIRARSASNIETVAFRPARERLEFDQQGGRMSVVNGLGQTVTRLVLRDGGRLYKLSAPLPPGTRATMVSGGLTATALLNNDAKAIAQLGDVVASQRDGSYLAVLEHSPFWVPGSRGVEERGSVHLVLGTGLHQP